MMWRPREPAAIRLKYCSPPERRAPSSRKPAGNWRAICTGLERGQADPVKSTRAFAHAAEVAGARIHTGQNVVSITPLSSGGYTVQTCNRTIPMPDSGAGNRRLVWPGGRDAGAQDTHRAHTRSDVGDGEPAAASDAHHWLYRIQL